MKVMSTKKKNGARPTSSLPDWLDRFGKKAAASCETMTPSIRWSAAYEDDYECWCLEIRPALVLLRKDDDREIKTFEHFQRIEITGIVLEMDKAIVALSDATTSKEGSHLIFEGAFEGHRVMLRIFREPNDDDEPIFRIHADGSMEHLFDGEEFSL